MDGIIETPLEKLESNLADISEIKLTGKVNGEQLKNGHTEPMNNSDKSIKMTNGDSKMNRSNSLAKAEWVRLNIGGKEFVTTKTTLCKNAQSFFYKLCQDDPSVGLTTDKVFFIRFLLIENFSC